MKHIIIIAFTLTSTFFNSRAQITLNGEVTYQNTGEKMDAIQILARGASPTITYKESTKSLKGIFHLPFPKGKEGDVIILELMTPIYELINPISDLQIPLTKDPNFKVKLAICLKGERDRNAVKYYNISTLYIENKYKNEFKKLQHEHSKQLKSLANDTFILKNKVREFELNNINLSKQLEEEKQKAWGLAEYFSRIDLAKADTIFKTAFEAFKRGDIDGARQILNGPETKKQEQMLDSLNLYIYNEEKRIKQKEEDLNKEKFFLLDAKVHRDSVIESIIKKKMFDGKLAELQFKYDEAEKIYWEAVNLDKKNIQNLITLGYFLKSIKKLDEAFSVFNNLLLPLRSDDFFKSTVISELSNIFHEKHKYKLALDKLKESISLKEKSLLYLPNSFKIFYAKDLDHLGVLYFKSEKIDSAGIILQKARNIYSSFKKDTLNYDLNLYSAENYQHIAEYYEKSKNIAHADSFYNIAIETFRILSKKDSVIYLSSLGDILLNYGWFCKTYYKYQKADSVLNESLIIFRNLSKYNPYKYKESVANCYQNIGNLYRVWQKFITMKQDEYALRYLYESLKIRQELYTFDSIIYKPALARNYGDLVAVYFKLDSLEQADSLGIRTLELFESLCDTINLFFYHETAICYRNLGTLNAKKNNSTQAIFYLNKALYFYNKLNDKNKGSYENNLADIYSILGIFYRELNNPLEELKYDKMSEIKYRIINKNHDNIYFLEWFTLINDLLRCLEKILNEKKDEGNRNKYELEFIEYKKIVEDLVPNYKYQG